MTNSFKYDMQGLADELLGPALRRRDPQGWLVHPSFPVFDESARADLFLASLGLESKFVGFESDCTDEQLHDKVQEGESCFDWSPTRPEGDGWVLLEIYPTEDGPYALFVRQAQHGRHARVELTVVDTVNGEKPTWRCFHCDEVFTDRPSAADHFGYNEYATPACKIDAAQYREMEQRIARANEDDSDTDREMYAMRSEHQQALRRAEEAGYHKGVTDMQTVGLDGYVMAPITRGFAYLGTGQYLIQNSAKGEPAQLVVSTASEADKANLKIGEFIQLPTPRRIQPETILVRLAFTDNRALTALEKQLQFLREEHFDGNQ